MRSPPGFDYERKLFLNNELRTDNRFKPGEDRRRRLLPPDLHQNSPENVVNTPIFTWTTPIYWINSAASKTQKDTG